MKLSTITSTSIVALAAAALIAGGASAAPSNSDGEKQCIDEGGSVSDGVCVTPSSGTPQPAAATTVKASKSNSDNRIGATPQPVEATTVKSSKSNSQDKTSYIGGPPQPAESANLNLSKSNINRTGDTPQPADGATIDTTKSKTFKTGGTPGTEEKKEICIIYKAGHEGDDRYCSQSVPAPN